MDYRHPISLQLCWVAPETLNLTCILPFCSTQTPQLDGGKTAKSSKKSLNCKELAQITCAFAPVRTIHKGHPENAVTMESDLELDTSSEGPLALLIPNSKKGSG